MSRVFWEEFLSRANISSEACEMFMERMTTTNPAEALSSKEVVFDALGPEVSSVEATFSVPTVPRSPRPKQTMNKYKQPTMKEKQPVIQENKKNLVSVHASPGKHTETQAKQKKDKQPEKVVNLEEEEWM